MTNQRDSSDLLVPIDEAIAEYDAALRDALWRAHDPQKMESEREIARRSAQTFKHRKFDLIRRRDAGETYEVMF